MFSTVFVFFSQPWRLGPGISVESCLQTGVPQIFETIYWICDRENKRQGNFVLINDIYHRWLYCYSWWCWIMHIGSISFIASLCFQSFYSFWVLFLIYAVRSWWPRSHYDAAHRGMWVWSSVRLRFLPIGGKLITKSCCQCTVWWLIWHALCIPVSQNLSATSVNATDAVMVV